MRKRDLLLAAAAVVCALAGAVWIFSAQALPTGAWGLHFRQEGAAPVGTVSNQQLLQYDAAYLGNTTRKRLYLTFDAGYENGCTRQILDTLARHQVKAAFFLDGNYIRRNADLVRRMVAEGHIVGNHTMHHRDMSQLADPAAFSQELTDLEELYQETTGQTMEKYYRPPQGIYSQENLKQAQALGYKTVFWSLAYMDWDNDHQPDPATALAKLKGRSHNGAVVLLHATSQTNARILEDLLRAWTEEGYTFGSVDELFCQE